MDTQSKAPATEENQIVAADDDSPPMRISGFEIRERIGAGGMAVVWKAHQKSLDRMVAVKVLRSGFAADPDEVRLFMNEARAAAKLSHPHVVQIHDTGSENGLHYLVMEYIAGGTVGGRLRSQGVFSWKRTLQIATCVAQALEYAWSKAGMVHLDIKPENIMIDDAGMVKVADLGLARACRGRAKHIAERAEYIEGTPNYMAPEQVEGSRADCRADIYALGATMYQMVTGRIPFAGLAAEEVMRAQTEDKLPDPRNLNSRLPVGFVRLLAVMLMKKPTQRPAGWKAVLRDIERVAQGKALLHAARGASTIETEALSTKNTGKPLPSSLSGAAETRGGTPWRWRVWRLVFLLLLWTGFALWLLVPFMRRIWKIYL